MKTRSITITDITQAEYDAIVELVQARGIAKVSRAGTVSASGSVLNLLAAEYEVEFDRPFPSKRAEWGGKRRGAGAPNQPETKTPPP